MIGMVKGDTKALIKGFQVRMIYVDGGSSSEVMYKMNSPKKFGGCGLHYPVDDKVSHRQWDCNNDDQERNPSRMLEDGRSTRADTGKEDHSPLNDEPLEEPPTSNPPKKVVIHEAYPDQTITIEGNLSDECRFELIEMLRKHFVWTPTDMTRIPRSVAEHELKTYPYIEPKVQRKKSIALDRRKVVKDEVTEWLKYGIVRKVRYPTWVANPVLVKKPDDSWRMCIDFKELNKACPKDLYPLPEIDWKIESLMGFKYKCFLDAHKGYHQIQMAKRDEEKTAFHTEEGGMGRNLEAYVDDMVIKSKTKLEMIKDVEETLMTLKKRLSGKLAALNRFLSKAAERALPCLDTLKKCTNKKDFHWTREAEEAFQAMKKLITKLPTLTAPRKEEELMVYLSAVNEAQIKWKGRTKQKDKRQEIQGEALEIIQSFNNFRINHIPKEENRNIETLSKLVAVQCEGLTKGVLIEELNERSMDIEKVNAIIEEATRTWMKPIQEYIKKESYRKMLPRHEQLEKRGARNEAYLHIGISSSSKQSCRTSQPKHNATNQNETTSRRRSIGKLRPKWERPYEIVETYGMGAYKLWSMDGVEIPHTWHSSNLRKYYM
nr:hypothetical protein [Tanacetum cinerariifolium]